MSQTSLADDGDVISLGLDDTDNAASTNLQKKRYTEDDTASKQDEQPSPRKQCSKTDNYTHDAPMLEHNKVGGGDNESFASKVLLSQQLTTAIIVEVPKITAMNDAIGRIGAMPKVITFSSPGYVVNTSVCSLHAWDYVISIESTHELLTIIDHLISDPSELILGSSTLLSAMPQLLLM